ncbi:MAG: hypothetical protein ACD_34C00254G0001 [uncultured bacterium]|nr:MAG: hypothetical protein ACD_34C00254G0001 [uncultured bacterium]
MLLNPCHVAHVFGFVRRVLQTLAPAASAGVSQTDERWLLLARHAAIVDRYWYRSPFTWVRQVLFPDFLRQFFQFILIKSILEWWCTLLISQ